MNPSLPQLRLRGDEVTGQTCRAIAGSHQKTVASPLAVLEGLMGPNFAFEDATHEEDGLGVRSFNSFWQAAEEAALSRLYGGIHFRAANENGLAQGRCVAQHILGLQTRA